MSYYIDTDFNLTKFWTILDFLDEFSEYEISDLISCINKLNQYKDSLSELFSSLEDSYKYSDVGTKDEKLMYKILSFSIEKEDMYKGEEN